MAGLFGTSGVRGVTNSEITPELVMDLSRSYGTMSGAGTKMVTGRDTRFGAQMLEAAAVAGLTSAGVDVETCGVVPMAALASYIVNRHLDGGVLITGSHMPPDRIGLILMNAEGAYTPYDVSNDVEEIYGRKAWTRVPFDQVGVVAEASRPLERYMDSVRRMVDKDLISSNRFHVLLDPGNGTASDVLPRLLRDLSCDIECLNCEPKPNPDRECEPRIATLTVTAQRAKELRTQLAAATDIDADRVIFFDENADGIPEDIVGCIFARYVLSRRKGPVVVPINSSILIETVCRQFGVPLHYCRVGQPATMEAIKNSGAVFSYEESGKYYFVEDEFWCDGILSTMKFLEIMAVERRKASELASDFPRLAQVKYKFPCPEKERPLIYPAVKQLLMSNSIEELDRVIELDGLKAIYRSGSWLLVRLSGTEPLVRIFAESVSPEKAKELADHGRELVRSVIGGR